MSSSPKSADLAALVDRLRGDLGDDFFVEVRHWDDDQSAIGLGNPSDPRFLVYMSVQPGEAAAYLECEVPAGRDTSGVPYDVASSGMHAGYGQILAIVRNHLAH
jgi:hypothetical protein